MPRAHPEWDLQKVVFVFLKKALPIGSEVQSNDSAKKGSSIQRIKDKERGILSGWPDVVCCVAGFPDIYFELKAPGNTTIEDNQVIRGENLRSLGRHWFTASSLEHIEDALKSIGVPLRASLGDRIAAPPPVAKKGKKSWNPKGPPKPSARQIARVEGLRMKLPF